MKKDKVEHVGFPSVINGNFIIQLPKGSEELLIEGIYNNNTITVADTVTFFTLRKSRLNIINFTGHSKNCLIDQCRISVSLTPDNESEDLYIKNSIIGFITGNSETAVLGIDNCVIPLIEAPYDTQDCGSSYGTNAMYKNNIIGDVMSQYLHQSVWGNYCDQRYSRSLPSASIAYNNVFIQGNADNALIQSGNMTSDLTELFDYEQINYDDSKTYELIPEAATAFLGTDGTQVGIYGGDTPFTNVPTNPQITQKNIATKSKSDGKLNVNITVEAQNQINNKIVAFDSLKI